MNAAKSDEQDDVDELESLLRHEEDTGEFPPSPLTTKLGRDTGRSTPVPYLQVFFVCTFRASQPLSFAVIFPFINNFLVDDIKVSDEVHVGHYSGLVETVTAFGIVIGCILCARLSDIYGRKWLTIIGVGINCVLCGFFGFTRTYWQVLLLRFMMGLAGGAQSATTKVMLSELSNGTNVAKCFTFLSMGWQMGATIAPMLGGILTNPAETWPFLFASTVFEQYPYALPPLVTGMIPGVVVIFAIFMAKETHPNIKTGKTSNYILTSKGHPSIASEDVIAYDMQTVKTLISKCRQIVWGEQGREPNLWSCGAGYMLILWFLILFQVVGLQVCELLFFFSSVSIGGLGLTPSQMSLFLTLRPCLTVLYEINVFPPLSKRYGPEACLRVLICIPIFTCVVYMLLSMAASIGVASNAVVIFALGLAMISTVVANSMFIAADVLIPNRSPTAKQLSTINTCGEVIALMGVASGAFIASSLFAASTVVENSFWRGKMVWFAFIGITLGTALLTQKITHIPGWREKEDAERLSNSADENDDV